MKTRKSRLLPIKRFLSEDFKKLPFREKISIRREMKRRPLELRLKVNNLEGAAEELAKISEEEILQTKKLSIKTKLQLENLQKQRIILFRELEYLIKFFKPYLIEFGPMEPHDGFRYEKINDIDIQLHKIYRKFNGIDILLIRASGW